MKKEYKSLSKYYDLIHNEKNYKEEVNDFIKIIEKYKKSKGRNLLDMCCGTGSHIFYLKEKFNVEGIDISKELIKIAKEKNPKTKFILEDISEFKTKKKFDIITILFSSIAYLRNKKEIIKIMANSYKRLKFGGVLFIETIFLKDSLKEIKNHLRKYSDKNINLKRFINLNIKKDFAELNAKYEIKEKNSIQKIIYDTQKIKLFSKLEMKKILEDVGFEVKFFNYKKTGTKLFVCVKVSSK